MEISRITQTSKNLQKLSDQIENTKSAILSLVYGFYCQIASSNT